MIVAMSPAASWGLLLLLVCVVVQAVLLYSCWDRRRCERERARRPIANRYSERRP